MKRHVAIAILGALTLLAGRPAAAQPKPMEASPDFIQRLESLARQNRLPDYEDLRLPEINSVPIESYYIESMPLMDDDRFSTDVVFADVPHESAYSRLNLASLLSIAEEGNFDLINSRRSVQIGMSDVRGEEAFFKPFVDLVADAGASRTHDRDALASDGGQTNRETTRYSAGTGVEMTQNLATGGAILADVTTARTETDVRSSSDSSTETTSYDGDFNVRFVQPLLRGSGLLTGDGTRIGTANLRRARLSEMDVILGDRLSRRQVKLRVIEQYFRILQFHQQLLVSRDAIRERERFLTETRIKYDVGRVAESEILRAQIQFLSEVETAISRLQQLDDAREGLLLLLGLPLETQISLMDITGDLLERGRLELPSTDVALTHALTNRLELMQADIDVALADISEDVARNDTLPDLDFDAGYGRFDSGGTFREGNSFENDTYDGGLTLRIPLQNIQRREAYKRSQLRADQQRTNRESLERDIRLEVLQTHRGVLTTEARLTVLRKRVEQARRNLELINGSFEVGFATITEVRLAQDDLFDAETDYSNSVLGYQASIARLYVAVGLPLH